MVDYRCYILDAEDHIVLAHDIDCDGDANAETTAQSLLQRDPYHRSVEVWRATRRVVKVHRDADQQIRIIPRVKRANLPLASPV